MMSRIAALGISAALTALVLVGLDTSIAQFEPQGSGLLFERRTAARYETDEFTFTAHINDLGLRERELSLAPGEAPRILAVGDSFTFGWGVEREDAWPALLEARLRAEGVEVEIVSVARGGASPCDYADFVERTAPLLGPDLVLVALLQGDDLAQLRTRDVCERAPWPEKAGLLSHLRAALRARTRFGVEEIGDAWREQAREFGETLKGGFRRTRYQRVDAALRERFEAGRFNPGLVSLAVNRPVYFHEVLTLDDEANRAATGLLAGSLERIDTASRRAGAEVAAVSVPLGAYVSPAKHASYLRTGFVLLDSALETTAMDDALAQAARRAGVPFSDAATVAFRAAPPEPALFHAWDGHFTIEGNRRFAEAIAPFVRARLEDARRGAISGDDRS